MGKGSSHFSFEDRERRESAQFIAIVTWVLGRDPDPTYVHSMAGNWISLRWLLSPN